jgi:hypothetical protein
MANLQVVITADRQAVGALVAAACRVPPTQWALPRAVGKWSRGQVTEHVALAYDLLARLETAMRDLETGLTAASNDRRTHLDHPILGRLPLADLLRFLMIHTQHHQPQLSAATT